MTHDEKASIEHEKRRLIDGTAEPKFRREVHAYAYHLTRNREKAEDYSQEAIKRFISAVKNKKTLGELEHLKPLPYIKKTLHNMRCDEWRRDNLGRRKSELPATQGEELIEPHVGYLTEEDQRELTGLGVEDQVVSKIFVEEFLKMLLEGQREVARLLLEKYQAEEIAEILKKDLEEVKKNIKGIKGKYKIFKEQQAQLEKTRSNYGK